MRKLISFLLTLTILLSSNLVLAEGTVKSFFNTDAITSGVIGVQYQVGEKKTKFMVEKDGQRYTYDVQATNDIQTFPLQLGNGEYTVSILENTTENKYKFVSKEKVSLTVKKEQEVFLNSVQNVSWEDSMAAIKKAKELTKNVKTEEEKIKIIYNYIVNNVQYDFDKVKTLTPDYLPNINDTFATNQGICYDYASLFASMLRSVGVPTKLVMGNTTHVKEYHAWNEVYITSKNQWITIDTTVDAAYKNSKKKYEMVKSNKEYTTSKIY